MRSFLAACLLAHASVACSASTVQTDKGPDTSADLPISRPDSYRDRGTPQDAPHSSPEFVKIAAGTFTMGIGGPLNHPCGYGLGTLLQVTLTHPFEIMRTKVTQGEFLLRMGFNPSEFTATSPELAQPPKRRYCGGPDCSKHPVDRATWHHAALYCNRLSDAHGLPRCYICEEQPSPCPPDLCGNKILCREEPHYLDGKLYECLGYRLPTHAEWEYAYRAGSPTPFYPAAASDGNWSTVPDIYDCGTYCAISDPNVNLIGWYCANSDQRTHAVGLKLPNLWGIYDMAGNVWEWCHDWLGERPTGVLVNYLGPDTGKTRVRKGGSYDNTADMLRASAYGSSGPENFAAGFRCARTLPAAD